MKLYFIKKISQPLGIGIMVALVAVLAINFIGNKIIEIVNQIERQKQIAGKLEQREQTIAAINSDFQKVGLNYEKKIDQAQPMVDNLLPFINAVDNLAKKLKFQSSLNLSPPAVLSADESGKADFKISFTITLSQINAEQLVNYLRGFESLPFFAGIDSLSTFSDAKNGWQKGATVKMIGKLYAKN